MKEGSKSEGLCVQLPRNVLATHGGAFLQGRICLGMSFAHLGLLGLREDETEFLSILELYSNCKDAGEEGRRGVCFFALLHHSKGCAPKCFPPAVLWFLSSVLYRVYVRSLCLVAW